MAARRSARREGCEVVESGKKKAEKGPRIQQNQLWIEDILGHGAINRLLTGRMRVEVSCEGGMQEAGDGIGASERVGAACAFFEFGGAVRVSGLRCCVSQRALIFRAAGSWGEQKRRGWV